MIYIFFICSTVYIWERDIVFRTKQIETKKKNKWNILGIRQSCVIPILAQNCKYLRKICIFGITPCEPTGREISRFQIAKTRWKEQWYPIFFDFHIMMSCRFHQANKKISVIYTLLGLTVISSSFHHLYFVGINTTALWHRFL